MTLYERIELLRKSKKISQGNLEKDRAGEKREKPA